MERSNYGLLPDEQPHPAVDKAALRGIVVQDDAGADSLLHAIYKQDVRADRQIVGKSLSFMHCGS